MDISRKHFSTQPTNPVLDEVPALNLKGKKILLIVDHPLNAEVAAYMLKTNTHCDIKIETKAEPALEGIANGKCYDLILMDINLGEGLSGFEAHSLSDAQYIGFLRMQRQIYGVLERRISVGLSGLPAAQKANRFITAYGKEHSTKWKSFVETLNQTPVEYHQELAQAALDTFAYVRFCAYRTQSSVT